MDAVDGGHTCYGGAHCMFEVHAWCELGTHAFVCEPCWICMHVVVNLVGYVPVWTLTSWSICNGCQVVIYCFCEPSL